MLTRSVRVPGRRLTVSHLATVAAAGGRVTTVGVPGVAWDAQWYPTPFDAFLGAARAA